MYDFIIRLMWEWLPPILVGLAIIFLAGWWMPRHINTAKKQE